jgi:N4-gp56 family major capsid protein
MAYTITTNTGTVTAVPKFYDKTWLERLFPQLVMLDYCIKKPIDSNMGTTIYFPRMQNTTGFTAASAYALTQGTIVTPQAVSDQQVSANIEQYGNARAIWDITQMAAISTFVTEAVKEQADFAAKLVDLRIIEESLGTSSHASGDAGAGFPVIVFNTNSAVEEAGAVSGRILAAGSEHRLTGKTIRRGVSQLRSLNVRPYDDGLYALVVSSISAYRLMADSEWQAAYEYTDPENMRKGVVGSIFGAKVIIDNNIFSSACGSNGATVYYSLLLGQGALGATELGGGYETYSTAGADSYNPLAQFTTFGWKWQFVAKRLNVSCGTVIVTAD